MALLLLNSFRAFIKSHTFICFMCSVFLFLYIVLGIFVNRQILSLSLISEDEQKFHIYFNAIILIILIEKQRNIIKEKFLTALCGRVVTTSVHTTFSTISIKQDILF